MKDFVQMAGITMHPDICHGKPVIRGLRYPVEWLLELLSSGMSQAEILADYPDLQENDFSQAYGFAAKATRIQRFELLAA